MGESYDNREFSKNVNNVRPMIVNFSVNKICFYDLQTSKLKTNNSFMFIYIHLYACTILGLIVLMNDKYITSLVDLFGEFVWAEEIQQLQILMLLIQIYLLHSLILVALLLLSRKRVSQLMKWLLYQVNTKKNDDTYKRYSNLYTIS